MLKANYRPQAIRVCPEPKVTHLKVPLSVWIVLGAVYAMVVARAGFVLFGQ